MHFTAASFIWFLFGLWQRDTVDTGSGSYRIGQIVGRVFIVLVIIAVVYALLKKRSRK
jgi:hypothetical protein